MSQSTDDKNQQIKSQIQLLKQKYLKKNVPTNKNIESISAKSIVQQQSNINAIRKDDNIKQSTKQIPKMQQNKNQLLQQKQNGKINVAQKVNEQEWSIKKFIQQQVKNDKKQSKQPKIQPEFYDNIVDLNDPFRLKVSFNFIQSSSNENHQQKDPQFSQHPAQNRLQHKLQKSISLRTQTHQKDLNHACKLWVQNPHKALVYLYYNGEGKTNLQLKSTNPSFPGIVQKLAEQFIFSNDQVLKESQKQVVYNMALQYFSPSPQQLSDVLLITLVKIVPNFASVYVDQIIHKTPYYMQRIIQLKKYLLKQQLDNFIKVIEDRLQVMRIEGQKIPNQCYIWILIVKPNSNYCHQMLLAKNFENQIQMLAIFFALYPEGKQNTLSILYLRCIDSLVSLFFKSGILENVISHLNQTKIPEVLYKPVKSLKLKLIKAADTKKEKKKCEEEKGFGNFLNQKMGKLKEALEHKVNTKLKTEVFYNTQSGQYQPVAQHPLSKSGQLTRSQKI